MNDDAVPPDITLILSEWGGGDAEAAERLMPLVYHELRRLARQHLQRERSDHTLQPTALVHEAYLRLVDQTRMDWRNRAQFYGVAAQLMRRVLVDHARANLAGKRGGGAPHVNLDHAYIAPEQRAENLLAVDSALDELALLDTRKSRVVELRFFAGLTVEETAETMGLNAATVRRDWTFAKAWLRRQIDGRLPVKP